MWLDNLPFKSELQQMCESAPFDWERFRGKTVLITGATGLIGHTLVSVLACANALRQLDIRVVALVRDTGRAQRIFKVKPNENHCIEFVEGTVESLPSLPKHVDYIVHGASITSSKAFVEEPVEVIQTAIQGTRNVLEFAKTEKTEKFVFLSSMEVYGYPERGHKVAEDEIGALPPTTIRNAYPLSKQLCESLCCAYASEYGLPTCVARLTQTFGPGVKYDDRRVFAEFARCALEKRDITLKTKGETERCYLYTVDAAAAILTLLIRGEAGEAYNVANEATYCSIADMARLVAGLGGVRVRFEPQDVGALGYANTLYMDLDTRKLQALGWKATYGLEQMYRGLMRSMACDVGENSDAPRREGL